MNGDVRHKLYLVVGVPLHQLFLRSEEYVNHLRRNQLIALRDYDELMGIVSELCYLEARLAGIVGLRDK